MHMLNKSEDFLFTPRHENAQNQILNINEDKLFF